MIAVDVGNSRTKFARPGDVRVFSTLAAVLKTCDAKETVCWGISSVNPSKSDRLVAQIQRKRPGDVVTVLRAKDVPLKNAVEQPDRVGIDRLLAAHAAVIWKRQNAPDYAEKPILVCDLGTAITVDLVSADDIFLGGAVLPGLALAAKSLRRGTALLPKIDDFSDAVFPATNTTTAIQCGIFEGAVGTIRRFYELTGSEPLLILTGGDAEPIHKVISKDCPAFFLPRLVLDGVCASLF